MAIGTPAKDFQLPDESEKMVRLSALQELQANVEPLGTR